jgi:hypothetical protein
VIVNWASVKQKAFSMALTAQRGLPKNRWVGVLRLESYMQFPIPQITSLMLLVHMGLGCCGHHAHQCVVDCSPVADQTPGSVCGDAIVHQHAGSCCEEDRHHERSKHRQPDPHRHLCEGLRCSFVRSERAPETSGELRLEICPWVTPAALDQVGAIHLGLVRNSAEPPFGERAPLRPHLLFSVLLI